MVTVSWLTWAVWLAAAPTALSQFNSTAQFTFDSLDGMVDLDGAARWWSFHMPWTMDAETGYRTSTGRRYGEAGLWFVGTGFKVHSISNWVQGAPKDISQPVLGELHYANLAQPGPVSGWINGTTEDLPESLSNHSLQLAAYQFTIKYYPSARTEFHNITIDVPILTQAPSIEELANQARFVPAARAERLNSLMTVYQNGVTQNQIANMFQQRNATKTKWEQWPRLEALGELNSSYIPDFRKRNLEPRRDFNIDIEGDTVVFKNFTEMSYKLPTNTTLIRVYGPVGAGNTTWDGGMCYATLDPLPAWWRNDSFPFAAEFKLTNSTNRTMFLLPVDPAVESTVKIGALGQDASCRISGISAYPFHYNYTFANMVAEGGNSSAGASGASGGPSGKSNKTGIIVGVVVGVVGALVLAALAVWMLRRRRAKKAKEEEAKQPGVEPFVVSEKEHYQTASWASHNAGSSEGTSSDSAGDRPQRGSSERPARRVVQEQDAEEAVEYLPPRYREWNGVSEELPPPPPLSVSARDIASPTPISEQSHQTQRTQQTQQSQSPFEYAKALGIAASPSMGQMSASSTQQTQQPPTLKADYAQAFGRDTPPLKADYAQAFAPETPPLKADYAQAFGGGTPPLSDTTQSGPSTWLGEKGALLAPSGGQGVGDSEQRPLPRPPSKALSSGSVKYRGDLKEDYERAFP